MLYPRPDPTLGDGLTAPSSPLASIFSGQTICLILFSFLPLHSFQGEQASFSVFPVESKVLGMSGGSDLYVLYLYVAQSQETNLLSNY